MGETGLPPITTSSMRFRAPTAASTVASSRERRNVPIRASSATIDRHDEDFASESVPLGSNQSLNHFLLSRQISFDTVCDDCLLPTGPFSTTHSLDEADGNQLISFSTLRTDSPEQSSFRSTKTPIISRAPSHSTTAKPSSQQVKNILKKYVLNKYLRSNAPAPFESALHNLLPLGNTPLHRASNSFDDSGYSRSTPDEEEEENLQSIASHSLPKKRAAYHRNITLSLDSSNAAATSYSRFHNNVSSSSAWKDENQPSACRACLPRQFSYNTQLAHAINRLPSPADASTSPISDTLRPRSRLMDPAHSDVEMPLDLTATTTSSTTRQPVHSGHPASLQTSSSAVDWKSIKNPNNFHLSAMKRVHTYTTPLLSSLSPPHPNSLSDERGSTPTLTFAPALTSSSVLNRHPLIDFSLPGIHNARLPSGVSSKKGLIFGPQQSSLRETHEILAALTLGGNSPQRPPSVSLSPSLTTSSSTTPEITNFFFNSLERAYDELLRPYVNLPTVDWSIDDDNHPLLELPRSALLFDPAMLSHFCVCRNGNNPLIHPECPLRIISILEQLTVSKMRIPAELISNLSHPIVTESLPLVFYFQLLRARMVTQTELSVFHTTEHIARFCPAIDDDESEDCSQQRMHSLQAEGVVATLPCGGIGVDSDTVWNAGNTSKSARLAVGQVMCLAYSLARGKVRNGFALVHPPGHHAEPGLAMGFCYFNSIAVASLNLLESGLAERVLILDWDIHHGNGTQQATAHHPGLMYVSLHRYDNGIFFPGTGGIHEMASKTSKTQGYVVNVAWGVGAVSRLGVSDGGCTARTVTDTQMELMMPEEDQQEAASARRDSWRQATFRRPCNQSEANNISNDSGVQLMSSEDSFRQTTLNTTHDDSSPDSAIDVAGVETKTPASTMVTSQSIGDAEYLAAMWTLVLPIATEFAPDVVLISAGFDGAKGHGNALGGYNISPGAFAWMTRQCMSLANGRIGLALEGGYVAQPTADCVTSCLNALLLPNPPSAIQSLTDPETRLVSLEDTLFTAKAWISPEELQRPPNPEAIQTIAKVAAFHAKYGEWRCLQQLNPSNIAMSFDATIAREREKLNQRL